MDQNGMTCALLREHCGRYPFLQVRDLFKFLHQSSFGCEHLISSPETVIAYIRREFAESGAYAEDKTEKLDGPYSRVHLGWMKKGLCAETLGQLFFLSAKKEPDGVSALERKLDTAMQLASDGLLPFSLEELASAAAEWKQQGYPAVRHSEVFREKYRPAYRVIADEYIPLLSALAELDVLRAQGKSISEKKTAVPADLLDQLYGCANDRQDK